MVGLEAVALTRRVALRHGVGAAAAWPLATSTLPSDPLTTLRRRVGQMTLAQAGYGLGAPDVYYPEVFAGTWRVTSRATEVLAPLGAPLFGGNASLAAARAELDAKPVTYEARWVRDRQGRLIADRPYNIASIAAATMGGKDALQQLPSLEAFDPNGLIFRLKPEGSDVTYRAELRALARRFEPSGGELRDASGLLIFDAGELTRQAISLPGKELVAPPSVKDIETINLFTRTKDGVITSTQRTSTWLVGTEGLAAMKAQAADGRAVDVRTYQVDYVRLK